MFNVDCYNGKIADAKEALSGAAFHAIVSHACGACTFTNHVADGHGLDASCNFQGIFSPDPRHLRNVGFNAQLKATSKNMQPATKNRCEYWAFREENLRVAKYSASSNVPLILVLFLLPPEDDFESWLEIDEEKLILRKCAYWTSLTGFNVGDDAKSSTIYVPKRNVLTPESLLSEIVVPLAEMKGLTYETP